MRTKDLRKNRGNGGRPLRVISRRLIINLFRFEVEIFFISIILIR